MATLPLRTTYPVELPSRFLGLTAAVAGGLACLLLAFVPALAVLLRLVDGRPAPRRNSPPRRWPSAFNH